MGYPPQYYLCLLYTSSAYHARGEDNHIVVPLKGQFKDGENFYSTLLHEMAHSTGEPEHLNREKGVIFGDKQYAKEELVAELTSATVGQSLGISTHIREENAMYLKNWLGALKEDPKFIYNILADVGKASNMIQEHTARMEQLSLIHISIYTESADMVDAATQQIQYLGMDLALIGAYCSCFWLSSKIVGHSDAGKIISKTVSIVTTAATIALMGGAAAGGKLTNVGGAASIGASFINDNNKK